LRFVVMMTAAVRPAAEPSEESMRYMLMIFVNPDSYQTLSEADQQALMQEYFTFTEGLRKSGELIAGDALQTPDTATSVKVRDGKRDTTDGPFIETKEYLAGYYEVECPTLDRALELAAQIPDARHGTIEVRPVWEVPGTQS
jgi:hypothetical protein